MNQRVQLAMPEPDHTNLPLTGGAGQFTTTHWSVVLAAAEASSAEAARALAALCQIYWYPLYAYVRRKGYVIEDAQDLTQEFFARFLGKNYLSSVDRQKGKFRSFLLASLEHFLAKEWTRANRLKRGGGQTIIALAVRFWRHISLKQVRCYDYSVTQTGRVAVCVSHENHHDRMSPNPAAWLVLCWKPDLQ
ncbi:MAG TPA: hypothetical protein VJS65_05320 [Verrucomicrobiae bacterium]|nr:hypothetical protein [Verrucomicrobiae bacterium]